MRRISIFLIVVALIAGMVGCGDESYTLAMAVSPIGSGTATDLTNASPYAANIVVNITAATNPGYRFVNWSAPAGTFDNATAETTTFTMPAQNVIVTANFAPFAGGSGTEGDPYQIADWYQLHNVRNYLGSYFTLMNDLDFTTPGYGELASPTANGGKGWQPIGTSGHRFTGSVDGQGYEISDLFVDRPAEWFVGLFCFVGGGGVIENLGVVNVAVTGYDYVCGLVGENWGTVSNSYATGNMTSAGYGYVGGLAGINEGTISNSYATAGISGGYAVGGLVGRNRGTVSDSYATGSVTGDDDCVGGLVGDNDGGTVSNSYSTGNVTGNPYAGGLVGQNNLGTVSNSFWDTETSGQDNSDGGTGKTTAEMQDIDTFTGAGWNITTVGGIGERNLAYVWNIVNHTTYPFLSWEPVS